MNHDSTLKQLGKYLSTHNFDLIYHALNSGKSLQSPWHQFDKVMLAQVPVVNEELLTLFHFAGKINLERCHLDSTLVEGLVHLGVLNKTQTDGQTYIDSQGLRIFPFNGLYYFIENWYPGDEYESDLTWFGPDSLYFAQVLNNCKGKKVLDLCTGAGMQGLMAALKGGHVESVEINPKAYRLAKWNAQLNNLEDHFEVHLGDLYQPVKDQQFDYIISNPPFIPSLEDPDQLKDSNKDVFLCGDAGIDGLSLLRNILAQVNQHLKIGGKAFFLAAGFGDQKHPHFSQELRQMIEKYDWDCHLIVLGQKTAKEELCRLAAELPDQAESLNTIVNNLPVSTTHYYPFFISIERRIHDAGSQFKESLCFQSWAKKFKDLKRKRIEAKREQRL